MRHAVKPRPGALPPVDFYCIRLVALFRILANGEGRGWTNLAFRGNLPRAQQSTDSGTEGLATSSFG